MWMLKNMTDPVERPWQAEALKLVITDVSIINIWYADLINPW